MKFLTAILLSVLLNSKCFSQTKGDNTIAVKGVGFMQVCNALLDSGYLVKKKDNDLQTAETDFKDGTGRASLFKYKILVRVKDSTAIITGHHYHALFNSLEYTRNTKDSKLPFEAMNRFALSFGKPVEYSKK